MGDTIYRQAAIDALICKMEPHNNGDGTMTIYVMSERLVRETLNDLPSAQPETPPEEQPEVTEEAVKEYCRKRHLCIVDSALLKKYTAAQPEERTEERTETHGVCLDVISRQAAIDALILESRKIDSNYLESERIIYESDAVEVISMLPTAFWKKRAREYEDIIADLVAEQAKGIKLDSITITEEGITFKKSQSERKRGKWILKNHLYECDNCGCRINRFPFKGNIWNYNFCPNCGEAKGGDENGMG